jgi:hypothetical protein
MSVWPKPLPAGTPLSGNEGTLASVSIEVEPRYLESLLEALAQLGFPVNPEIYHDAAVVYVYPDGRQESTPVTLVEFPAYESRLDDVRRALDAYGFDSAAVSVIGMLDAIHSERVLEPAPGGAAYAARYRVRRRAVGAAN